MNEKERIARDKLDEVLVTLGAKFQAAGWTTTYIDSIMTFAAKGIAAVHGAENRKWLIELLAEQVEQYYQLRKLIVKLQREEGLSAADAMNKAISMIEADAVIEEARQSELRD